MRVISKARLKRFWQTPGFEDAEAPLRAWYTHVASKDVCWHAWGHLKAEFGTASAVGNCVVFDIGGNKYRLIPRPLFPSQKVFVLRVMTHAEYDRNQWQAECGCYAAPPPRPGKGSAKPTRRR